MENIVNFILEKRSFTFHFWATILSGGLWIFIYIVALLFKQPNSTRNNNCDNKEFHNIFVQKALNDAKSLNTDLVEMTYELACSSEQAKYRGRVFSISGKDKRFPYLNSEVLACGLTFYPFIYGISEPCYCKPKDIIEFSNRPFIDDRTEKEKSDYELSLKDKYYRINNSEYSAVFRTHYQYLEKINMLYTIANNLSTPNSSQMEQVISLCIEDIKLAPKIREYYDNTALPIYPSFQRLAIIYEKQKEYQKAIEVCNYAITLGFYKDGTAGQLPGRLARLIKKATKENIKIDEHSTIL